MPMTTTRTKYTLAAMALTVAPAATVLAQDEPRDAQPMILIESAGLQNMLSSEKDAALREAISMLPEKLEELKLTIPDGLIAVEGTLSRVDGHKKSVYFEGKLREGRPFGCYQCAPKCSQPGVKCGCSEIPPEGSKQCMEQPMNALLRKNGKQWEGRLPQRVYSVVYEELKPGQAPPDRAVIGFSYEMHAHRFIIRKKKR